MVMHYPNLPDAISLTTKSKRSIVKKRTEIGLRLLREGCK